MKKSEMGAADRRSLIRKILVRFSLLPVVLGSLTLWPAGTFDYWQAYVYGAFLVLPMTFVLFYFLKNDPQFLERRTRTRETERVQKVIQIVFSLFFVAAFVVSGFDRRFGWSEVPVPTVLMADIVGLLGYLIVFVTFRQNSYASRIVEVDAGQTVVSTGVYGIVRHPMYVGVMMMWIPIPIALGSYWGLVPLATIPLALVLRILNEEAVLLRELPGYREYCGKTRYRLIPYLW